MKFFKIMPDLTNKRQLKLWTKAQRNQWAAEDIDWTRPQRITQDHLKDQMGRVLTPVLMSEHSALYSVAGLIPILGREAQVASQFFLTTWAVDEARHTELFARMFQRIDREPLPIRKFPAAYLFQTEIYSEEPHEWLCGLLIAEVLATTVMKEFMRIDIDPVLSDISDGILGDESRHLGFNHIYLEDSFQEKFGEDPEKARALAAHLHDRLSRVIDRVPPMLNQIDTEFRAMGIDPDFLLAELKREARERLENSIQGGARKAGKLTEVETRGP